MALSSLGGAWFSCLAVLVEVWFGPFLAWQGDVREIHGMQEGQTG